MERDSEEKREKEVSTAFNWFKSIQKSIMFEHFYRFSLTCWWFRG